MRTTLQIPVILLIALTICQNTHAQSGRVSESPVPTPEVPAPTEAVKLYEPCDKELEKIIYISVRNIAEFTDELNRLGNCGYRMEKFAKIPLGTEASPLELKVFGVVKLNVGSRYEYNWFAASSPGELRRNANFQAEHGFYYRENVLFIAGRCSEEVEKQRTEDKESNPLSVLLNYNSGFNGSMYIFERKNGVIKKREYRVLSGNDNDGKKTLPQNQKALNDFVALGFRPVGYYYLGYFDVFAILAEKDEEIKPEGDYLLKRQVLGITKKFSKLAREGYEPFLVGDGFAVLHRKKNEPVAVSYKTDSPSQLAKKISAWDGAYYQVKGIVDNAVCDPYEGKLFFAVPLSSPAKKYDYKFLQMTNVTERLIKKKEKNATFSDLPTEEKMREFQKFISEGYEVRELFYFGEIFVLFERELSATQIKF